MTTTKLQPEIALDHGPDSIFVWACNLVDHYIIVHIWTCLIQQDVCLKNVLFTPVDGTSSRENYDYPPVIKGNNRKKTCIVHVPVFFLFSHVFPCFPRFYTCVFSMFEHGKTHVFSHGKTGHCWMDRRPKETPGSSKLFLYYIISHMLHV